MEQQESMLKLLGRLSGKLRIYDPIQKERAKLKFIKLEKIFGPKDTWICALCGRTSKERKLHIHHIFPLEEGGQTDDEGNNLIILCDSPTSSSYVNVALNWYYNRKKRKKKKSINLSQLLADKLLKNPEDIGCHYLAQNGFISINKVRFVKNNRDLWGKFKNIRSEALGIHLEILEKEFYRVSGRRKKFNSSRDKMKEKLNAKKGANKPFSEEFEIELFEKRFNLVKQARRLTQRKDLQFAQKHCQSLQDYLIKNLKLIPPAIISEFYYEKALLHMIQHPTPDLDSAGLSLKKSCEYALLANDKYKWAKSSSELLHVNIFNTTPLTETHYQEYSNQLNECLVIIKSKNETNKRNIINILCFQAQLQVKAGKIPEATKTLSEAFNYRDDLDISSGWTKFQATHLNSIKGALFAWKPDYYINSLESLSRALIAMKKARAKRPEGYKDIALCAFWVLSKMGKNQESKEVHDIARLMVDGRSGFWTEPPI